MFQTKFYFYVHIEYMNVKKKKNQKTKKCCKLCQENVEFVYYTLLRKE